MKREEIDREEQVGGEALADEENPSPFHSGELAMQRDVGVAERMDGVGRRVIRSYLLEQHREFFEQLPFLVAGAVDHKGDAWATWLTGKPGFAHSPDAHHLRVSASPQWDDPAHHGIHAGSAIGLLGIELHTRRRNRLNGVIDDRDGDGFTVNVQHSFGNCPRYIQKREWNAAESPVDVFAAEEMVDLDADARRAIAAADTLFVASYVDLEAGRQVDVSHRGGKPGFVRVNADGTLTLPEFSGNNHFNTLGNLIANPRSGLLFVDFERGDVLQLSGLAEVHANAPEAASFVGAERLWTFTPRRIVRRRGALPIRFEKGEASPHVQSTGSWIDVASSAAQSANRPAS